MENLFQFWKIGKDWIKFLQKNTRPRIPAKSGKKFCLKGVRPKNLFYLYSMITVKIIKTKTGKYAAYCEGIGIAYGDTIPEAQREFMVNMPIANEIIQFDFDEPPTSSRKEPSQ